MQNQAFQGAVAPRPPVALHLPMNTTEMCHVTKLFDALFIHCAPSVPNQLQMELDLFELEFAGKYNMQVGHC